MTKRKPTFADILKATPKPIPLTNNTKLPYVFDLHWDCKEGRDLALYRLLDNPEVRRLLGENGFDVKTISNLSWDR